jgi:hypothetical protein
MESTPVLVGFGGCPKGGRVLSGVVKILPLGEKQTEVAAVFQRRNIIGQPSPLISVAHRGRSIASEQRVQCGITAAPPSPMRLGAPPRAYLWSSNR